MLRMLAYAAQWCKLVSLTDTQWKIFCIGYGAFKYDVNRYGGLAKKKQMAYEINAGKLVGKTLDPSSFGLEDKKFNEILCELKSVLAGTSSGFQQVMDGLKTLV